MTASSPRAATSAADWPAVSLALAAAPVIAIAVSWLTGHIEPMSANLPSLLGNPLGIVLLATAGVLTAMGMLVVWRRRTWWARLLALVTCTVPALLLIALGPPLIEGLLLLG